MNTIFVCAPGSDSNIGSSITRRSYRDCLRERGPLVVWTGPSSRVYVSGLGLRPSDEIGERHLAEFQRLLRASVADIRGRLGRATPESVDHGVH